MWKGERKEKGMKKKEEKDKGDGGWVRAWEGREREEKKKKKREKIGG